MHSHNETIFFLPTIQLTVETPSLPVKSIKEAAGKFGQPLLNVPLVVTHQSYPNTSPVSRKSEAYALYICKSFIVHNP